MRPVFRTLFFVFLIACASQKPRVVTFDGTDIFLNEMTISFHKIERQANQPWLISGRVIDRQSGQAIPGVNVIIAESEDITLSKAPRENPYLRAVTATDREGYFEIRSANITPVDVIIFKFIGFRDQVYTIGDFLETYPGEEN